MTSLRIILTPEPCGLPFVADDGERIWLRLSFWVHPGSGLEAKSALPWKFLQNSPASDDVKTLRDSIESAVRVPTDVDTQAFDKIWNGSTNEREVDLSTGTTLEVGAVVQGMATLPAKLGRALGATHYVKVRARSLDDEEVLISRDDIKRAVPTTIRLGSEDLKREALAVQGTWLNASYGVGAKVRTAYQTDAEGSPCWKLKVRSDLKDWLVAPQVGGSPPEQAEYARAIDDFDVFKGATGVGSMLPEESVSEEATENGDSEEAIEIGALNFFVLARVLRLSRLEEQLSDSGKLLLSAFDDILIGNTNAAHTALVPVLSSLAKEMGFRSPENSSSLRGTFARCARLLQRLASWDGLDLPIVRDVLLNAPEKDAGVDNRIANAHTQLEWNSYFAFLVGQAQPFASDNWLDLAREFRRQDICGTHLATFLGNLNLSTDVVCIVGGHTPSSQHAEGFDVWVGGESMSTTIQGDENGASDGLLLLVREDSGKAYCANWTAVSKDAGDASDELDRLIAPLQPRTAQWEEWHVNDAGEVEHSEHEWWSLATTYRGEPLVGERPDAMVISEKNSENPLASLVRLSWSSGQNTKSLGLRFGTNFSFLGLLCDSAGGLPWSVLSDPQDYEKPPLAERLNLASEVLQNATWSEPSPYLREHHAGEIGVERRAEKNPAAELCPKDVELYAEQAFELPRSSEAKERTELNLVRVLLRSGDDVASKLASAKFKLTPPRVVDLGTIVHSGWPVGLKKLAAERFLTNTADGDTDGSTKSCSEVRDPGVVGLAFRITDQSNEKPGTKSIVWTVDKDHLTSESCAVEVKFEHLNEDGISFFIDGQKQEPLGVFAKIEVGYQYSEGEWSTKPGLGKFSPAMVFLVERVTALPTTDELRASFAVRRSSSGVTATLESGSWPSIVSATLLSESWTWRNLPLNDISNEALSAISADKYVSHESRLRLASAVPAQLVITDKDKFVGCGADPAFENQCAYDAGFLRRNNVNMARDPGAPRWMHSDSLADLGDRTVFLRYGIAVSSRYAPVLKPEHQTATTLAVRPDALDLANWPYRGVIKRKSSGSSEEIDAPRILAVLPLTRTLGRDIAADEPEEPTPALVICDGEWFRSYGLGDRLVATVVKEDDGAERVGPLPTHDKKGHRPNVIGELFLIGPIGYSIDRDEVQARANCSAFVIVPPLGVGPHYFASLTFQRKLDGFLNSAGTVASPSSKPVGPFSWYTLKGSDRLWDPQTKEIDWTEPYLKKERCEEGYRKSGVAFYRYFKISGQQALDTLPEVSEIRPFDFSADTLGTGDRILEVYCDPSSDEPFGERLPSEPSVIQFFKWLLPDEQKPRDKDANGRIERISDPIQYVYAQD